MAIWVFGTLFILKVGVVEQWVKLPPGMPTFCIRVPGHSTSDPASCYYAPWEAQVLEPHPLIWKAQFKVLAVGLSLAVSVVGF